MVQQQVTPATASYLRAAVLGNGEVAQQHPELEPILAQATNPSPELANWVERAKGARIFSDLSAQQVAAILAPGTHHHYAPGDVIIPYGDTKDSLFALLADGRVRIVQPINLPPPVGDWLSGEKSLLELPAPQVVGHFNLLSSTTRSATVEAITDLDAVEVQKDHLERLSKFDISLGYVLMRNMALALQAQVRFINQDVTNLTVAVALAARALKR